MTAAWSIDIDNLNETVETAVGGDNITGNEIGRRDLLLVAVTHDLDLGGERGHESLDSVIGVPFFVETDGGVDE